MTEAPLRTFIALDLPPTVLDRLAGILEGLRHLPAMRWVRLEGIHLTLQFLGATPREQVASLSEGVEAIAGRTEALDLEMAGAGTFGGSRVRVVWVGVGGEVERLRHLAREVEVMTGPLGFEGERREFNPHLTLGRVREGATPAERKSVAEAVRALEVPALPFRADRLVLFRSELRPGGAIYTPLASARLRGPDAGT